jgi:hypothetical protein
MKVQRSHLLSGLVFGLAVSIGSVTATDQSKYDVGVTDTEIKIGNVMPYRGPASLLPRLAKRRPRTSK